MVSAAGYCSVALRETASVPLKVLTMNTNHDLKDDGPLRTNTKYQHLGVDNTSQLSSALVQPLLEQPMRPVPSKLL